MVAVAMEIEPPPAPHPVARPVKRSVEKKCEHGKRKQRYQCRECRGGAFCKHGIRRSLCRECGGGAFCKHGIQRSLCRECGGSAICKHDVQRSHCRECGGSAFCKHGIRRSTCRECGGGAFCKHGKHRNACSDCHDLPCTIEGCPQFGHRFSSTANLLIHMRAKHSGEAKALTKAKELNVYGALQAANIDAEYQKYIPFRSCGLEGETRCAYLDFVIVAPWGIIILEVDEHQHSSYPAACDIRRDFDIYASIAMGSGQKVAILRYNPDEFRIDSKTVRVAAKDRQHRLIEVLRDWIAEDPVPNLPLARFFLYYDGRSGTTHPPLAQASLA